MKENHHHNVAPQNLAMDIVKIGAGTSRTFEGDPKVNESYACWAQPIYSPIGGVVEISVDGIPDNIPGEMNAHMVSGNCMMIRSSEGFVVVLCHFKNGSVAKKKGDVVKSGDLLGLCGNSGNSSEPHLHFQIQSQVGFVRGVALRPVFRQILVSGISQREYSPKKGDRVSNLLEPD
jgi:murein DD-endopeptidase MepM/ murein hydrolase activator NlpD